MDVFVATLVVFFLTWISTSLIMQSSVKQLCLFDNRFQHGANETQHIASMYLLAVSSMCATVIKEGE